MVVHAGMPREVRASNSRQNPTRIPYSCHAQFGTSGSTVAAWGGGGPGGGIGFSGSPSPTFTIVQTAIRAPFGSFQGVRCEIAEYGKRSRGNAILHSPRLTLGDHGHSSAL